jgi:two-component system nitrogen regulation response regulator GlnG
MDVETVDPAKPTDRDALAAPEVAFVEIVFHPDLRMVGARAMVAAAGTTPASALVIGRDLPIFALDDGESRGPLADPCVSRRQLAVRWHAAARRFGVDRAPGARREVSLLAADGRDHAGGLEDLEAGTLVAIGDRILLRLDVGPLPGPALGLLGGSRVMHAHRRTVEALASRSDSVLVLGESGTGKELVARALHHLGPGRSAPFMAVNCATLPDTLVEAELFGVEKGAFSGATERRDGLFRAAGRGTIFLDEIGELSLSAQSKLLRALQERRVRPVGGTGEQPFEARVVMATHRDLERAVEEGGFRADLYARIESPALVIPPVRERREDVARLFVSFLATQLDDVAKGTSSPFRAADVSPPALPMEFFRAMLGHPWPRNVREIQKVASRVAMALRSRAPIDRALLAPQPSPREPAPARAHAPARRAAPTAAELVELLDRHDFVQNRLAKALGISRTTLDKWMRDAGVRRPSDLAREEIATALARFDGDLAAAARGLGISQRGLRLRMTELGLGLGAKPG